MIYRSYGSGLSAYEHPVLRSLARLLNVPERTLRRAAGEVLVHGRRVSDPRSRLFFRWHPLRGCAWSSCTGRYGSDTARTSPAPRRNDLGQVARREPRRFRARSSDESPRAAAPLWRVTFRVHVPGGSFGDNDRLLGTKARTRGSPQGVILTPSPYAASFANGNPAFDDPALIHGSRTRRWPTVAGTATALDRSSPW
jgi:hypothetical protein